MAADKPLFLGAVHRAKRLRLGQQPAQFAGAGDGGLDQVAARRTGDGRRRKRGLRLLQLVLHRLGLGHQAPQVDAAGIELRPSKGDKYLGVTLTVMATSREQLDELYRACERFRLFIEEIEGLAHTELREDVVAYCSGQKRGDRVQETLRPECLRKKMEVRIEKYLFCYAGW